MAETLKPGTPVEWTSQSGGYRTRKEGSVVAFLPKWDSNIRDHLPGVSANRIKVKPVTYTSSVDRYLVEVGGSFYYAPHASLVQVRRAEPQRPDGGGEPNALVDFANWKRVVEYVESQGFTVVPAQTYTDTGFYPDPDSQGGVSEPVAQEPFDRENPEGTAADDALSWEEP